MIDSTFKLIGVNPCGLLLDKVVKTAKTGEVAKAETPSPASVSWNLQVIWYISVVEYTSNLDIGVVLKLQPHHQSISHGSASFSEASTAASDLGAVDGALPIPEGKRAFCWLHKTSNILKHAVELPL